MSNLKKYSISGWSSLSHKYLAIQSSLHANNFNVIDEKVTDASEIKIFLTPGRCSNETEEKYHKTYKSSNGFVVGEILSLIVKTYWAAVDDIYDGDIDRISNLALHTFHFDKTTNLVYPETDS